MWREGNPPTLLVGMFIGTATMENGMKVKVKIAHLCPTLCDPMDYTVREGNGTPLQYSCHGQRSLVGCGPWGREESDTTE